MSDGNKALAGIFTGIIIVQFFFGIHYIQDGWANIMANNQAQNGSIKEFLTIIFSIFSIVILIAVSIYYFGAPSSRIKRQSFYGWLIFAIGSTLFYLLVILFVNTDLLQYGLINLLLIFPLLISWLIISTSIGYMFSESGYSGGNTFINFFHFFFLVILIARIIVAWS